MSKTAQEVRNFCWPDGTSWWSVPWVSVPTVLGPSYRIIQRTTTWSTVTCLSRVSLSQFSEPLPSSWGPHGTCAMFRGRACQEDLGRYSGYPKTIILSISVCGIQAGSSQTLLCACSFHLTPFGQLFPWFLFEKINFWHWHMKCLRRKPFVGTLLSKVLRNTFACGAHHETSLFFF